MTELLGKLESEQIAEENQQCRDIVVEIMKFGVNERQLKVIIRLLAFELENMDLCRELVGCLDEVGGEGQRIVSSEERA